MNKPKKAVKKNGEGQGKQVADSSNKTILPEKDVKKIAPSIRGIDYKGD